MNLGIIGLPQTGKKTLFKILTGQPAEKAPSKHGIKYGIAPVKDPRIDRLTDMYQPKKTKYAEFDIALPPDIAPDTARSAEWIDPLRKVDAFLQVIRAFEDPGVYHIKGNVAPERDLGLLETELLLADLAMVETRLGRLVKELRKDDTAGQREKTVLEKCIGCLEEETMLRNVEFNPEESSILTSLQLLTLKPMAVVFNTDEDLEQAREKLGPLAQTIRDRGDHVVFMSADIEADLLDLEADEKMAFMEDLGISEPAAHRLSRAAYDALGLISFFTVGPDEVRAWPLRKGSTAPEAAGKIHTDLRKGFIRAETIAYDDLINAGSEKAAKDANLMHSNGKDYVVKDGDVINIQFSR